MTLTVSWGIGSSARTWSLSLPGTAALAESVPALAAVSRRNQATVKRALSIAEPFLALGAEAAGAGVPELLLVVAAVAAAKQPAVPGLPRRTRTRCCLVAGGPRYGPTRGMTCVPQQASAIAVRRATAGSVRAPSGAHGANDAAQRHGPGRRRGGQRRATHFGGSHPRRGSRPGLAGHRCGFGRTAPIDTGPVPRPNQPHSNG